MEEKIYAFIDSQNLNMGFKASGCNLDFKRFRLYLKNKYSVSKAFIFIGYIGKYSKLYAKLKKYGYHLVFKPTISVKQQKSHFIKGNIDAELVLHTMIHFNNFNKVIIVSGDGDFYCLIKYLHEQRKLKKVIVPNTKYSSLLREFNKYNYIFQLTSVKRNLCKKKRGIRGRSKP